MANFISYEFFVVFSIVLLHANEVIVCINIIEILRFRYKLEILVEL